MKQHFIKHRVYYLLLLIIIIGAFLLFGSYKWAKIDYGLPEPYIADFDGQYCDTTPFRMIDTREFLIVCDLTYELDLLYEDFLKRAHFYEREIFAYIISDEFRYFTLSGRYEDLSQLLLDFRGHLISDSTKMYFFGDNQHRYVEINTLLMTILNRDGTLCKQVEHKF